MASLITSKFRRNAKGASSQALINPEGSPTPLSSDTLDAAEQSGRQKKSVQRRRRVPALFRLRKNRKENKAPSHDSIFEENLTDLIHHGPQSKSDIQQPSRVFCSEDKESDEYEGLVSSAQEKRLHSSVEAPSKETNAVAKELSEGHVSARSSADSVSMRTPRLELDHGGYPRSDNRLKDAALHLAVKRDSLDSIRFHLELDADVHSVNQKGETPLHVAAMNGSVDALIVLLAAGAAVNVPDPSTERTPLDCAIEGVEIHGEPFLPVVRTLVRHNATLSHWNAQKLENMCAKAIANDFKELVEIYLDNGCDPNACSNEHGWPLFAVAAKFGKLEIGKLLLKRRARADGDPLPLFAALMNNQPHFVEFLLTRARQNSELGLDNRRCLRIAALEADIDLPSRKTMIKVLLRNGVDINIAMDSSLNTVLFEAVRYDKPEVIEMLADLGADVNAYNRDGSTPLMVAAQTGNTEAAQVLIRKAKAVVGCGRNDGSHALHVAIAADREAMVLCLLAEGAPVDLARGDGVTPLQLAVMKSNLVIVKMLLDAGADMSRTRSLLIQEAIKREAINVLELLLHYRREARESDSNGAQWLLFACRLSKSAAVGYLLDAGVDPNGDLDAQKHPLHAAILAGANKSLELLVEAGADPNLKNGDGVPSTILAFRQRNFYAVHALVSSGKVDLASTTADGSHVLHEAISNANESMVSFLLSKGAPVNQVGANGETPLKEAVMKSDGAVVKLLLDAGADVSRDGGALLASAIENDDLEMLRLLHGAGLDLDQVDDNGNLPLSAASEGNKTDILQFLLDAGAAVNKTTHGAATLLMTAVLEKADRSVIAKLLDDGAHPNTFHEEVNTPLHIAVRDGNLELVRLLLEHGADQFICNARQLNARQIARRHGFTDIIELLDLHAMRQNAERQSQHSTQDYSGGQAISSVQFLTAVGEMLVCPITLEVMKDPVLAPDGHCYERSAITSWLRAKGKSPVTRQQMSIENLLSNVPLKQQIDLFQKTRRR